jgi:5-hmdU DNA kinase, helical domain
MRRIAGVPPPWTDDYVLANHKFTNVYRASDRVSQYLIRHVLYDGDQTTEEIFFRALLFKFFNRIETWEELTKKHGLPTWKAFQAERYAFTLDGMLARGERVYSGAYIMPSPPFGEARKHRNHLRLLDYMMRDAAPKRVENAKSLAEVFGILRAYPSLGDFLAFQFAIDLNYSQIIDFSEMDFVVAGPGARDGIRKCFNDTDGLTDSDVIRLVADVADSEFERLQVVFQSLWGRKLHLIDCQNLFCEVDKYARVIHPSIKGVTGRSRIKQKFAPNPSCLPQWYPPKWGLKLPVVATGTATSK